MGDNATLTLQGLMYLNTSLLKAVPDHVDARVHTTLPSKNETFTQGCFNVEPASQMVDQHCFYTHVTHNPRQPNRIDQLAEQTRHTCTMFDLCRPTVYDVGPTSIKHCVDVSERDLLHQLRRQTMPVWATSDVSSWTSPRWLHDGA